MNAGGEPLRIPLRHLAARRAIDEDGVGQMFDAHVLHEAIKIRRRRALFVPGPPIVQLHPRIGQQHTFRAQQSAHPQIELDLIVQAGGLGCDLIQQNPSDASGSDDPNRQRMRRQIQARVHGA